MINILLDVLDFSADFLYEEMKSSNAIFIPAIKWLFWLFPIVIGRFKIHTSGRCCMEKAVGDIIAVWFRRFFDMEFLRTI